MAFQRVRIFDALMTGTSVTKTVDIFALSRSIISKVMLDFGKLITGRKVKHPGRVRRILTRIFRKNYKRIAPEMLHSLKITSRTRFPQNCLSLSDTKLGFTEWLQSENHYFRIEYESTESIPIEVEECYFLEQDILYLISHHR